MKESDTKGGRTLSVNIQGKSAYVSFDDQLFWLNRRTPGIESSTDASQAYICVPHALILYCSFIPDSDGGDLLLRLLTPPSTTGRSPLLPFSAVQSRAARVVETREELDQDKSLTVEDKLNVQLQGPCSNLRLVNIEARVSDVSLIEEAKEWALGLMDLAYHNIKPYRKLKMLVNPVGGSGQALKLFHSRVRPILEAAGCVLDVTVTKHVGHGKEVVQALSLDDGIDVIVTISGDGMVHEVLNGLASREDAEEAMKIPVAPIPAGSGNAVAVNLLGTAQAFNLALACLNVIKGKPMLLDVCTITQPTDSQSIPSTNVKTRKTTTTSSITSSNTEEIDSPPDQLISASASPYTLSYTFLSQAIGLMADIDLGTEDLRALGDSRFVLGYIGGIISNKECEIDVYVKLGERGTTSKAEMRKRVQDARKAGPHDKVDVVGGKESWTRTSLRNGPVTDPLPNEGEVPILDLRDPTWSSHLVGNTDDEDQNTTRDPEQWYRIATPIAALYGGKIPYVARDLLSFPYAYPGDNCVDFVFQLMSGGRRTFIKAIQNGENGTHVYHPAMVYLKVDAYRIVPRLEAGNRKLKKGGLVSIDGEHRPYKSYQVEVHPSLRFRVQSLYGRWCVPDVAPPTSENGTFAT